MTDEQRAALERLRKSTTADGAKEVYGTDCPGILRAFDCSVAAEIAVAEHPADDDEPLTDEWMVSVGGKQSQFDGVTFWRDLGDPDNALVVHVRPKYLSASMAIVRNDNHQLVCSLPTLSTRGDLRRLCQPLGITLNETGSTT